MNTNVYMDYSDIVLSRRFCRNRSQVVLFLKNCILINFLFSSIKRSGPQNKINSYSNINIFQHVGQQKRFNTAER